MNDHFKIYMCALYAPWNNICIPFTFYRALENLFSRSYSSMHLRWIDIRSEFQCKRSFFKYVFYQMIGGIIGRAIFTQYRRGRPKNIYPKHVSQKTYHIIRQVSLNFFCFEPHFTFLRIIIASHFVSPPRMQEFFSM